MAIATINVHLTRGEFISSNHLREFVDSIYQHEVQLPQRLTQPYMANIYGASVYVCVPRSASLAYFLWSNSREFEVVIETSFQGNLLSSSESVARGIHHRLRQLNMNAEFRISLQASDAQTYIHGEPNRLLERLWDELKHNLIACFIGVIIIIVAKLWLTDYYQEAIASVIGLITFSLWKMCTVFNETRKQPIYWRICHD